MTLNALIINICSVNFICADVTAMLFRSAIILTVWQATSCSEFNTFNVKLSVITVCFPVIFKLSGPRNVLKIVCAIDRLRIWKHCLTTMCLSSSCLVSISEWPSPTQSCLFVRCSALSPKLIFKPLFNSDQFQLNARCLFIVRANVSNLSKIYVRFVADIFHTHWNDVPPLFLCLNVCLMYFINVLTCNCFIWIIQGCTVTLRPVNIVQTVA